MLQESTWLRLEEVHGWQQILDREEPWKTPESTTPVLLFSTWLPLFVARSSGNLLLRQNVEKRNRFIFLLRLDLWAVYILFVIGDASPNPNFLSNKPGLWQTYLVWHHSYRIVVVSSNIFSEHMWWYGWQVTCGGSLSAHMEITMRFFEAKFSRGSTETMRSHGWQISLFWLTLLWTTDFYLSSCMWYILWVECMSSLYDLRNLTFLLQTSLASGRNDPCRLSDKSLQIILSVWIFLPCQTGLVKHYKLRVRWKLVKVLQGRQEHPTNSVTAQLLVMVKLRTLLHTTWDAWISTDI